MYYFAVSRRPDIVNTAILNYSPVQSPIEYYTIKNSIASTPLNENSTQIISSDTPIQCRMSQEAVGVLELAGKQFILCSQWL